MPENNENQDQNGSRGTQNNGKSRRGFAAMDPERQRAIASKGGQIAHQRGSAHEFNSEEARAAGRLGGRASRSNRGSGNERGEGENE